MKSQRPFKVIQEIWPAYEDHSQQPTELLPVTALVTNQPASIALPLPATSLPTDETSVSRFYESTCIDETALQNDLNRSTDETALQESLNTDIPERARISHNRLKRGIALALCLLLAITLYFAWHTTTTPAPASPPITQQIGNSSSPASNTGATDQNTSSETIQVYILGAVLHPGVYTLPADARIYELLKAAGGPLPHADLISLNLAAKLTDGQEVYVLTIGQAIPDNLNGSTSGNTSPSTPDANSGQLVNINTATESEMEQNLHVSAATATKIINYRTQHGSYTSTAQLLQVISQSIYNRIKTMVTV